MAIVSSDEGALFSTIVGTKPISPFQSGDSPPGSTVVISLTSFLSSQSLSSSL